MGDMTKNFDKHEFACKGEGCCGHSNRVSAELVNALQKLRDKVGVIHISSSYRCPIHNKEVGGKANSFHLLGLAADIFSSEMAPALLAKKALTIPEFKNGGIGVYSTFVHVDIRKSGKARW